MGGLHVLDLEQRAALAGHPSRRAILEHLLRQVDSSAGIARALGEPRQRVNHHVRALEEAGLIVQTGERRRGNCVERVMRARAERFLAPPTLIGGGDAARAQVEALAALALAWASGFQPRIRFARLEGCGPEDVAAFGEELERSAAEVLREFGGGWAEGVPAGPGLVLGVLGVPPSGG